MKPKFLCSSSGKPCTKKRRYRVLNKKIQNIMSFHEDKTGINFFRALPKLSKKTFCLTVQFMFYLFNVNNYTKTAHIIVTIWVG